MIKVLQVFGSLNMGGAESRMMDVYRHLDRNNYEFDFLTLQNGEQFYENEILQLGGKIINVSNPRECGIVKHILEMRRIMSEGHYNAVHAHTLHHCGIVMLSAWLAGVPIRISHSRSTNSKQKNKKFYSLYLGVGRMLIKMFATKKLAITNNAGNFLYKNGNYITVPNSIDLNKYQSVSVEQQLKLRTALGVSDECFIIGQIGRFEMMKNHQFTLNWFSEYIKEHSDAVLVLVGEGTLKPDMEKMAVELGIREKVIFTGVRNDVPQLIHTFNVLFFPSLFEGLGGVVLEAQAAGVPTVESDVVSSEADMGLGMVTRCSLSQDLSAWTRAVDSYRNFKAPSNEEIKSAFDKNGYSIEAVVDTYCRYYQGE